MSRIIFAVIAIFMVTIVYANQRAITDTGEEVILNSDGTWVFTNESKLGEEVIKTNKSDFKKPASSTFLLKSTKNNSAFWINANTWTFKKATDTAAAEYDLQLKNNDLFGLVITEAISVPVESLTKIALTNAKDVAPDMEVLEKEYRYVNGLKVIYMEMAGTLQGMKITYLGYYYSNESGATQFLIYTGTNLVDKYKEEITDFLNGLDVQ